MTGPNPPSEQIDQLMTGLRETLAQARAGRPAEDPEAVPLKGTHGEDGAQIKAVVSPNRIVSLELDPRTRRMDSEELAAAIVAAINGAFDDLGGKAREAAGNEASDVDTEALSEKLDRLQDASVRQMAMFEQAMSEVVARLMGGRS